MVEKQLQILEEDNDILVCVKPAGIPVQTPKTGQKDMVSLLRNYRAGKGEQPMIFVVHRLDQPVRGIMVFAKNQKAAASLSGQIQKKAVEKTYHALVEGEFTDSEGTLTDYLLRDGRTNTSRVVTEGTKGAKQAILKYRVLQQTEGNSLVEIDLLTGRHHQIRVQMAHAGHPLVGDKKYNPHCESGYRPIELCSVSLAFEHPATGKTMEYTLLE